MIRASGFVGYYFFQISGAVKEDCKYFILTGLNWTQLIIVLEIFQGFIRHHGDGEERLPRTEILRGSPKVLLLA